MGKRPTTDFFTTTLGKQVAPTPLAQTLAQFLHPESWEVYIFCEEEDEREPGPLVSKNVSH